MIGKRGIAPCGHPGEHLTANYVRCAMGCDAGKPPVKEKGSGLKCPRCASTDVEPFTPPFAYWSVGWPGDVHCMPCGHAWWKK